MKPLGALSLLYAFLLAACAYPEEMIEQGGVRSATYVPATAYPPPPAYPSAPGYSSPAPPAYSPPAAAATRDVKPNIPRSGVTRPPSGFADPASPVLINVVEPGDSTLSCEELKAAIDAATYNVNRLSQARNDAQSKAGTDTALSGLAVTSSYAGRFSNLFGPITQALASKQSSNDQQAFQMISENLSRADQRRTYLVGIHNQRCF